MPSNSYNAVAAISRDTLIEDAYREIGVLGDGKVLTGNQIERATRKLNMLMATLARSDMRGEFTTIRKRVTLFLQKGQAHYQIGGSDHCTQTYYETTAGATIAAAATSIQVVSSASMTIGDYVGVLLTSGSWEWHTILTIPDSTHYTIASPGMVGTAASGATVVNYTTALTAPLEILTAVLRDTDDNDTPISLDMTLADYELIGDKAALGDPFEAYVEYARTTTDLWSDRAANDASRVVRLTVRMPFSDMDASTDTFDCSQAGLRALLYALAVDLAPSNSKPITPALAQNYATAMAPFLDENSRTTDVYFQPGAE